MVWGATARILKELLDGLRRGGMGMSLRAYAPDDERLRELLESWRTIAVVGLSADPCRPSFGVARYLIDAGYDVIPVHPDAPGGPRASGVPDAWPTSSGRSTWSTCSAVPSSRRTTRGRR